MRKLVLILGMFVFVAVPWTHLNAQGQTGKQAQESDQPLQKDDGTPSLVVRMMAFNKKKDGKLTREEVTDSRLHRLFDLADTNKDGVVTREELMALAARLDAEWGQGGTKGGKGPKGKGPGGKRPPPIATVAASPDSPSRR